MKPVKMIGGSLLPTICRGRRKKLTDPARMSRRGIHISYVDQWFASIVKSTAFYEEQSSPDHATRCYFYNTDLQGRLFLEEVLPKNVATSIKDTRFLNFFFSRLRRVNSRDHDFMEKRGIPLHDYPFVSPCGKELNFVRPAAATPVVFHSLIPSDAGSADHFLVLAGNLKEIFSPHELAISLESGRLYHRLTTLRIRPALVESENPSVQVPSEYGLLRSAVAVAMSDRMVPVDTITKVGRAGVSDVADPASGWMFQSAEDDVLVPIQTIPPEWESSPWAMPIES